MKLSKKEKDEITILDNIDVYETIDPLDYYLNHDDFKQEVKIFSRYPQLKDFIKKCFTMDYNTRPSASDLLKDEFFLNENPVGDLKNDAYVFNESQFKDLGNRLSNRIMHWVGSDNGKLQK